MPNLMSSSFISASLQMVPQSLDGIDLRIEKCKHFRFRGCHSLHFRRESCGTGPAASVLPTQGELSIILLLCAVSTHVQGVVLVLNQTRPVGSRRPSPVCVLNTLHLPAEKFHGSLFTYRRCETSQSRKFGFCVCW